MNKPIVALVCAVSLAAMAQTVEWTAPAKAAKRKNPITANAKSIRQGKELYTQACLPCHGESGVGDGPAANTLDRDGIRIQPGNLSCPIMLEQTDGAIFWKITTGTNPMPAFEFTLTPTQRWHVVNYVRTLVHK